MKTRKRITASLATFAIVFALALVSSVTAFAAVVTDSGSAATLTGLLSDYKEFNAELNAKAADSDTEMNGMSDSARTFDFGFRVPSYNDDGTVADYMGGETIGSFSPGAYRGTGLTVDENTTKLRLKTIASGSGMARYRYAYPVKLNGLTVDYNFSELVSGDHLCVTFSGNYDAFRHTTSKAYGITLTYYVDASDFIFINFGRSNTSSLTGNGGDVALVTDKTEGEEESFSVRTTFEETDSQLIITVANGGTQGKAYRTTVDKSDLYDSEQNTDLCDKDGNSWINLGVFNDSNGANDNNDVFCKFVIRIRDENRTAYEASTLNALKSAMTAYTAEAIEAAQISDISAVDEWVERRDAVGAASGGELRISDAYLYSPETEIAAANTALKQKCGEIVDGYLGTQIDELATAMTTADGDDYTTITDKSVYEELYAKYTQVHDAYNVTYAGLTTSDFDAQYIRTAKGSLDRLSVHLDIYALEQASLDTATDIVAARFAYNESKSNINSRISTLQYGSEIKTALQERLDAAGERIREAEENADPSELVGAAVSAYESKTDEAANIDDIYAALSRRALIPQSDEFTSRIEVADNKLSDLAWELVRSRVETIETLGSAGVDSYAKKAALGKAVKAVSDRDLLTGAAVTLKAEHKARYDSAVKAAQDGIAAWQAKLAEYNLALKSRGGDTDSASDELSGDVTFSDNGLDYKFTGDQSALVFKKGYDIFGGIEVTFSVKQWAYLMNDGKGYSSNNTWIYFTNDPTKNRGDYGSVAVMFWNMVSSSDVKVYFETDVEEDSQHITTFGEDDGSYVTVTFKANGDRRRYEMSVNYYAENGELKDGSISYLSYTNGSIYAPAVLFPESKAYVGIAGYMTNQVGNLYNEWSIRKVGDTEFASVKEPDDEGNNPGGDKNPADDEGKKDPAPAKDGLAGWAIALIVIACVLVVGGGAATAVILVKKNKKSEEGK